MSMLWLTVLTFLLTISTFVYTSPGLFFAFVLLNGIGQATAGSYLQTSIIAVASLLGPAAIQAMMSGQAAVGVAVSLVQVISAAASVRQSPAPSTLESAPEESSAFAFFALSTAFLVFTAACYWWLLRLPAYNAVIGQFNKITHGDPSHVADIGSPDLRGPPGSNYEQITRVLSANVLYNIAVCYVFTITLVGVCLSNE